MAWSLRRSCYGDYAALKPDPVDVTKGVVGWCSKVPENTGFTALRLACAVVKISAPRSSFDPVSARAPGPKTFFSKKACTASSGTYNARPWRG